MANMFDVSCDYAIKQIVLKKMQIRASVNLPRHLIEMGAIEKATDMLSDSFIYQLSTYVTAHSWTDKHSNSFIVEVPLTWIDAVRLRFAPKFLADKYPIQYRKIKSGGDVTTNYWVFPEIPPNPDKYISDFIMSYGNGRTCR